MSEDEATTGSIVALGLLTQVVYNALYSIRELATAHLERDREEIEDLKAGLEQIGRIADGAMEKFHEAKEE